MRKDSGKTKKQRNDFWNSQRTKRDHFESNVKHVYGISIEYYGNLRHRIQDNKCAMCVRDLDTFTSKQVHIDHDKITGKVRGLLCHFVIQVSGSMRFIE